MIQLPLDFDAPIARQSDPATSHLAAERVKATMSRRCAEAYEIVKAHPGICGSEVEAINFQARKRLKELERRGRIRKGEPRVSRVSGLIGETWYVT